MGPGKGMWEGGIELLLNRRAMIWRPSQHKSHSQYKMNVENWLDSRLQILCLLEDRLISLI